MAQNAYTCIELNAHTLVLLLVSIMLRTVSLARSMSSTFSSIINFGVLGLLHRLQIQAELQRENKVKHPTVERH